jgi:hypothetical protein
MALRRDTLADVASAGFSIERPHRSAVGMLMELTARA